MNRPDPFENEQNEPETLQNEVQEPAVTDERSMADPAAPQEPAAGEEPRWYGISYAGDRVETALEQKKEKRIWRRVAMAALCFVLCVAISGVSVFLGFYYARHFAELDSKNGGHYVTGTETGRNRLRRRFRRLV